jgi:hypothetical protein
MSKPDAGTIAAMHGEDAELSALETQLADRIGFHARQLLGAVSRLPTSKRRLEVYGYLEKLYGAQKRMEGSLDAQTE